MSQPASSPLRDRQALAGRRFLVVDDQHHMIEVVSEMLRHYAAKEVLGAEGVEAALFRCAGRSDFDCIVCDFNMQPVNGIQFLQAIRGGQRPEIPRDQRFLLLTGHGDMDVVKAAKALDVSAYVVKPVAPDTFIKSVTRAMATAPTLRPPADYIAVPTTNLRKLQ
ncbi:MAG: response regulator [Rhodospirillaceae bacterium]|nr:response regulator [Rhodospirillaceae bacterium]